MAFGLLLASAAGANDYMRGYALGVLNALAADKSIQVTAVDEGKAVLETGKCVGYARREALEKALTKNHAITTIEWRAEPCRAAQQLRDEPDVAAGDAEPLPEGELFPQLLADPHEPQFAAHYQAHQIPNANFNAALAAFGDYFPFVRRDSGIGRFEFGIHSGIFSLFNLDGDSFDLINTDFIVGFPLSYRPGSFAARAQVYHQSSHLGDELLLGMPNIERVNLSYEDAELLLAYEFLAFRLYGGGGYLYRTEPDLDPAHWQGGLEFRWSELIGGLDLVAASDFQAFEEQDWEVNRSYQLGVAWRSQTGREVRLVLERYDGFSPMGLLPIQRSILNSGRRSRQLVTSLQDFRGAVNRSRKRPTAL